jgi:hypothetical protein
LFLFYLGRQGIFPCWPWTRDPPASASWVAGIIDVCCHTWVSQKFLTFWVFHAYRILLCSSGWPQTCNSPASWVLGLQTCASSHLLLEICWAYHSYQKSMQYIFTYI